MPQPPPPGPFTLWIVVRERPGACDMRHHVEPVVGGDLDALDAAATTRLSELVAAFQPAVGVVVDVEPRELDAVRWLANAPGRRAFRSSVPATAGQPAWLGRPGPTGHPAEGA